MTTNGANATRGGLSTWLGLAILVAGLLNGIGPYLRRTGLIERDLYETFWSLHTGPGGYTRAPLGLGRRCVTHRPIEEGGTAIEGGAAAKLGERRTYDFSKGVPEAGAGMGSGLLSGLFGAVGDIADTYGARSGAPMSPGQPTGIISTPEVGGLSGSFQDVMGDGASPNGVGPNGVSLDDLKNLYKLGGSGTANFG